MSASMPLRVCSPAPRSSRPARWLAAGLLAGLLPTVAAAQYYGTLNEFGSGVATTGDQTGLAVAVLGDVNGDGTDELIIGAPYDDDNGTDSGTVYVVNGYPSVILYEMHGSSPGNHFGTSVASMRDVDGDGVDDFVVGSPGTDSNGADKGGITAYSGKTGVSIYSQLGPKAGSQFGTTVAGGGDLNGDGYGDFVVGAPFYDNTTSTQDYGWAAVYSGHHGSQIKVHLNSNLTSMAGSSLAFVGDVDGDGREDYAVGAPGYDYVVGATTVTDGGLLTVYSGIDFTPMWVERGSKGDVLSTSVAGAGDMDADGQAEVLGGAPGEFPGGSVTLFEGELGSVEHKFSGNGYTSDDAFGTAVGPLGDVNHDGHSDILVGAPLESFTVGLGGYIQAFSGADYSPWGGALASPNGGDALGSALSATAGDLSGDDWTDVLVGYPFNDFAGTSCGIVRAFTLTYSQPNLNFQGPGVSTLVMYGTQLYPGGLADMGLWYSKPDSPAFLVASAIELIGAFKGGTLVPSPAAALIMPFVTDSQGRIKLTDIPGGGGPLIVFMQFLIQDASQPAGWQLSNAIAGEFLP